MQPATFSDRLRTFRRMVELQSGDARDQYDPVAYRQAMFDLDIAWGLKDPECWRLDDQAVARFVKPDATRHYPDVHIRKAEITRRIVQVSLRRFWWRRRSSSFAPFDDRLKERTDTGRLVFLEHHRLAKTIERDMPPAPWTVAIQAAVDARVSAVKDGDR